MECRSQWKSAEQQDFDSNADQDESAEDFTFPAEQIPETPSGGTACGGNQECYRADYGCIRQNARPFQTCVTDSDQQSVDTGCERQYDQTPEIECGNPNRDGERSVATVSIL